LLFINKNINALKTKKITLNELKTLIKHIIEEVLQSNKMDFEQSVNYLKANYDNLVVKDVTINDGPPPYGKAFVSKQSWPLVKYVVGASVPLNKMRNKDAIINLANHVRSRIERVDHRAILKKFIQ
jgi:hypothetical protein